MASLVVRPERRDRPPGFNSPPPPLRSRLIEPWHGAYTLYTRTPSRIPVALPRKRIPYPPDPFRPYIPASGVSPIPSPPAIVLASRCWRHAPAASPASAHREAHNGARAGPALGLISHDCEDDARASHRAVLLGRHRVTTKRSAMPLTSRGSERWLRGFSLRDEM